MKTNEKKMVQVMRRENTMKKIRELSFQMLIIATFLVTLSAFNPASAQTRSTKAPPVSFKGKVITILIPFSVGGSSDIMLRMMVPFMGKYFPGNPTIIVKNFPGAGGIVGENWVSKRGRNDGTLIGQYSTVLTHAAFAPEKIKFNVKELQWLGGVREPNVDYVHTNLGIKSAEDLLNVKQKIFLGVISTTSPSGMMPRLFLKILGLDHKVITGYGSSGGMRVAMRRGELNMTSDRLSGYSKAVIPMVKEGVVVPIVQAGMTKDGKRVRDSRLPQVPTYTEILVKLKGEGVKQKLEFRALDLLLQIRDVARGWVYTPGVPEKVFKAMAVAFKKILKDQEMRKLFKKTGGFELYTVDASQSQQIADSALDLLKKHPKAVELLKGLGRKAN